MGKQIDYKKLRKFTSDIFNAVGINKEDCDIIADSLVDADMRGISSHGVSRIPIYIKRIITGVVSSQNDYETVAEYPACLAIDAKNTMGIPVSVKAVALGIAKAKEVGTVTISIRQSNHYGTASYFTRIAARNDLIAISTCNTPPKIAPTGSTQPFFGTNPISIAIPTYDEPIVLDMATSVVANGKIVLAAKEGKQIPLGWALDKYGKETTDPEEAKKGTLLPIGGPKGYGLAMMIEILSGLLSGSSYGPGLGNFFSDFDNKQDVGQFFILIDVSKFTNLQEFKKNVAKMTEEIKSLDKAKGVGEIFLPGEIEQKKYEKSLKEGIVLSDKTYDELEQLAKEMKVDMSVLQ